MNRARSRLALVAVLVALVAAACAHNAPASSLRPAGTESRYIDHLYYPVFWIAVGVFVLVAGLTLFSIVRFRARSVDDRPRQIHGSFKLEVTWTVIPLLLLTGVAVFSVIGIFHLARSPKGTPLSVVPASATSPAQVNGDVLEVKVIAHRWWFEFRYPGLGPNGADLITANELHIPVHKDVYASVTSNEPAGSVEGIGPGVIHTFWVPRLGPKIQAIPGRTNHVVINADAPGVYPGQCTQFCGIGHANMRLRAVATSDADFASWVMAQQKTQPVLTSATQFTDPEVYAGFQLFNGAGTCSGCHTINGTSAAGQVGPNLTHLFSRSLFAGASMQLNNANLRLWLRDPQAVKPGVLMRIPHLTEDQITALISYLDTLQ